MRHLNIKRWAILLLYATVSLLITLGWSGVVSLSLLSALAPSYAIESPLPQQSSPPSTPSMSPTQSISSAQSLFNQGVVYFQAERFTEAIATWNQILNTPIPQRSTLPTPNALAPPPPNAQIPGFYNSLSPDPTTHHRTLGSYLPLLQRPNASTPQLQPLIHSNLSLAYQHLGQWQNAETSLNQSLAFFQQQSPSSRSTTDWDYYAKALNAQGWLFWRQGHPESALDAWQQAQLAYESADYFLGVVGSQINQARALQSLGFSQAAAELLADSRTAIAHQNNPPLQAMALQALGNGLRRVGDLEQSEQALKQALDKVAVTAPSLSEQQRATQSSILLDLGNTERSLWEQSIAFNLKPEQQEHYKRNALEHYQHAGAIATSPLPQAQADANQLALLVDIQHYQPSQTATAAMDHPSEIWTLWQTLTSQFPNVPLGRSGIEVKLKSVNSLLKLNANSPSPLPKDLWTDMADVLGQTIQQARQLQDSHTEALATGQLGQLYESTQQWSEAQPLTEAAIALAESIQAPEIRYRWEWQLGRLHEKQGDIQGAIEAYSAAYNSLKSVRSDLLTIDSNTQFSFRDTIAPIHRRLVDLLLSADSAPPPTTSNPINTNLINTNPINTAIEVIDSLQLAELENLLRCNFSQLVPLTSSSQSLSNQPMGLSNLIEQLDPTAALIYPILLDDRLEIILKLPGRQPKHYATVVEQKTVEHVVKTLQVSILQQTNPVAVRQPAQQIYDWFMRPLEFELEQHSDVETLVFVLDGALRNIPMAVLHDGDRYLIEQKYGLAVVPSLQLFDLRSPRQTDINVLAVGVSQAQAVETRTFAALPNVPQELQTIHQTVPTDTLLNEAFSPLALEQRVKSGDFSTVHIATHGKFSSNPNETYIAAHNKLLRADDLDNLLRTETRDRSDYIDLLVLSACETASGDDRATLGLAGLAVRAGARSTLSTLWQINDQSTAFMMKRFYQELTQPNVSRAEALHQAQLSLLNDYGDKSPFTWAPYILVGNWR